MDRTVQIIWSWTRNVGVTIKSLTFDYKLGKSDLITVSWQIWEFVEILSKLGHIGILEYFLFYFIIEK